MKFVHCADVHLDSPLRGLEAYEGAPVHELRSASRRAFDNVVSLCLDERVDFLLIAGDLYDGEWTDFNTGLYFVKQMTRLAEHNIPVLVVQGNHDAQSRITKRLPVPSNTRILSARKPESITLDSLRVAIHGQSYAQRKVDENLAERYPAASRGWFNIGLLHTALDGREGHEPYAPCSIESLRTKDYDYWALGHVHKREVLCEEPWVVFPGNVQGRHARETGRKGCTLVSVEHGRVQHVEHRDVDVLRWDYITVDASGAMGLEEVLERVRLGLSVSLTHTSGRLLAARIRLIGCCPVHDAIVRNLPYWKSQIRAVAMEAGFGKVWIEKVEVCTEPALDLETVRQRDDAVGELLRLVQEIKDEPQTLEQLRKDLDPLLNKVPELLEQGELADVRQDTPLTVMLQEAEKLLLARLMSPES